MLRIELTNRNLHEAVSGRWTWGAMWHSRSARVTDPSGLCMSSAKLALETGLEYLELESVVKLKRRKRSQETGQ
jgi:hypothetical protein